MHYKKIIIIFFSFFLMFLLVVRSTMHMYYVCTFIHVLPSVYYFVIINYNYKFL